MEATNPGKQINKGYAHAVNIYGRGDISHQMTRSLPTKNQIIKEITDLLGLPPVETTVGSSIPSIFFSDVASTMGIPIVSGMPVMARRIIENAGLLWHPDFSSESAPSGGGGTVTALGLLQVKNAALIWLGHSPDELPVEYQDWEPDPDWQTKREQLPRELRETIDRPGAFQFRELVLSAYENKCAITGSTSIQAIEVAHIVPYYGAESDHIENALPLRAALHKLFDKGLLIVYFHDREKRFKVKLHDFVLHDYRDFQDIDLKLPVDSANLPSRLALSEHEELFKNMWQVI